MKNFLSLLFFCGVFLSLSFIFKKQPLKVGKPVIPPTQEVRQLTPLSPPPPSVPYEECTWRTQAYTDKLIQEHLEKKTEAKPPCTTCGAQALHKTALQNGITPLLSGDKTKGANPIPPICFFVQMMRSPEHSPSSKEGQEKFVYCEDSKSFKKPVDSLMLFDQCNSKREECQLKTKSDERQGRIRNLFSRRFCLNEDYLQLTMNAFNKVADCFDFSEEDKEHMFKLISHESYFMLNKRGPTEDACYGQVTNVIHHHLNRYIVYKEKEPIWVEEYNLYKNAVNKKGCGFLSKKVVHFPGVRPEDVWGKDAKGNDKVLIDSDKFDKQYRAKKYSMFCSLTHDPYSCFLYSFYNYKINESAFDEEYVAFDNTSLPSDLMRDFHAPIGYNEMIVFRGDIIKPDGSVTENIELMFADHDEIYKYFIHKKYSYSEDSQIYKVNVFPKDILQKDVLSRAYQGGKGIITWRWRAFMSRLKDNISNLSNFDRSTTWGLNQYKQHKAYREALTKDDVLLNPEKGVLKAVDLDREFSRHLYGQGRETTSQYVSKMEEGSCFYEGNYIKNLLRDQYNVKEEDRESIVQYVQENCPSRTFETSCSGEEEEEE